MHSFNVQKTLNYLDNNVGWCIKKSLPYLGLEKSGPDDSFIAIPVELKIISFIQMHFIKF